MKRAIIIREGVDVILDCSHVVEKLDSDNLLVPPESIWVTWFIQRLNTDLETLGDEELLDESPLPLDETITQYVARILYIVYTQELMSAAKQGEGASKCY